MWWADEVSVINLAREISNYLKGTYILPGMSLYFISQVGVWWIGYGGMVIKQVLRLLEVAP